MHIEGYFNEHDEPCLSVDLGSGAIEVLIDTGFSGSLIIPQTVANDLALNFEGVEEFYRRLDKCSSRPRIPSRLVGSAKG